MNQSELSKTSTIEKEDARMCEDAKKTEEEEETSWCPLFMEGLPTDFASNPQLADIASLLEDDDADGCFQSWRLTRFSEPSVYMISQY
jgi:hypothetical protein